MRVETEWSFGCPVASERITRGGFRACRAEKGRLATSLSSLMQQARTSSGNRRKSQTEAAAGEADEDKLFTCFGLIQISNSPTLTLHDSPVSTWATLDLDLPLTGHDTLPKHVHSHAWHTVQGYRIQSKTSEYSDYFFCCNRYCNALLFRFKKSVI